MLELGYSGPSDSAFGTKAGAGPEENMKEPVLWVGALAGTTGAGKAAGSGAWDILEVETGGGSRGPSEGQEATGTSLELKKSRSDDGSFCIREISGEQRPRRGYRKGRVHHPPGPSELPIMTHRTLREDPLEAACPSSSRADTRDYNKLWF